MSYIPRYIDQQLEQDIQRKMVFIGGPRQCGKTTVARQYAKKHGYSITECYMNWDDLEDRENIIRNQLPTHTGLLIFDEIHKYPEWRRLLKGLFDKRGDEHKIIVTGSARLDYYRRGGDSLQGRYHFLRLLPFTLSEVPENGSNGVTSLLKYGCFPEPYLQQSEIESRRWSREYRTRLVRDDLRDLENIRDIVKLETMAIRLPELVGSPLSLNGLREDLHVSHQTVNRWFTLLESLYYLFIVSPFGSDKIRALKKMPRHYHYDWTLINDPGHRFENLVACHLWKWVLFMQDSQGRDVELRYFRDVDGREVDFIIMENNRPVQCIECKNGKKDPTRSLKYIYQRFPYVEPIQVSLEGDYDLITGDGIRLISANRFLTEF